MRLATALGRASGGRISPRPFLALLLAVLLHAVGLGLVWLLAADRTAGPHRRAPRPTRAVTRIDLLWPRAPDRPRPVREAILPPALPVITPRRRAPASAARSRCPCRRVSADAPRLPAVRLQRP